MALIILFSIQMQWNLDSVSSRLYPNFKHQQCEQQRQEQKLEQEQEQKHQPQQLKQRHHQKAHTQRESLKMIWWLIDIIYCHAHHQHLRPKYSFFHSYHFNNGQRYMVVVLKMMKMIQFYAHITMRLVFSWWNVYCRPVFRIGCQMVVYFFPSAPTPHPPPTTPSIPQIQNPAYLGGEYLRHTAQSAFDWQLNFDSTNEKEKITTQKKSITKLYMC